MPLIYQASIEENRHVYALLPALFLSVSELNPIRFSRFINVGHLNRTKIHCFRIEKYGIPVCTNILHFTRSLIIFWLIRLKRLSHQGYPDIFLPQLFLVELRCEQEKRGNAMIIDKEIREFIEENFLPEKELLAEDSLLQKRIIDSTGILEMVAFLEGRYGFIVEDDELVPENLDSIRKISTYVHRKIFLKKQDFCFAAEQV